MTTPGTVVYFAQITTPHGCPVKIGTSVDSDKRVRSLDAWCPWPMEMLAQAPGGRLHEAYVHARFNHVRQRYEWFAPSEDLLAYVASVRLTGRLPGAPPYRAGESRHTAPRYAQTVRELLESNGIPRRALADYLGLKSAQFQPWDNDLPPKHLDALVRFFASHGVTVTPESLYERVSMKVAA